METKNRLFWGFSLIAIAAVIFIDQMGLLDETFGVKNIILGFLYGTIFLGGILKKNFFCIFLPIGLSWLTFSPFYDVASIPTSTVLLIVVLLSIGFSMLFPKKTKFAGHEKWDKYENADEIGEHQKVTDYEASGVITCQNRFGALAKYVTSTNVKSATLENSFGELKVFFDQAKTTERSIDLHVSNNFGELQIYIPKEWIVKHNVKAFAAACNIKNQPDIAATTTVNIVGSVNFGEISIIYV